MRGTGGSVQRPRREEQLPDLPFLPGFGSRADDVPKPRIHTMDFINGFPLPKEAIDPASAMAAAALRGRAELEHARTERKTTELDYEEEKLKEEQRVYEAVDTFRSRAKDAVRPFVPEYVLKDKIVLVFAGYFVEDATGAHMQVESQAIPASKKQDIQAAGKPSFAQGQGQGGNVPSLNVPRSVHPWTSLHSSESSIQPRSNNNNNSETTSNSTSNSTSIIKTAPSLVRRVVVSFFVEDGTISVVEPSRGPLISRQQIPKDRNDRRKGYYGERDLDCGRTVDFYGRLIVLADADEFTKKHYKSSLRPLAPSITLPDDTLSPNRTIPAGRLTSSTVTDGPHNDKLGRFLLYDRQVLRLFGTWLENDGKVPEDRKECILQVYLVDDTCEVREERRRNDGSVGADLSTKFPLVLKRGPIPKVFNRLADLNESPRYTWRDMGIGVTIDVLHRKLLITDCDDFTRSFLAANLGLSPHEIAPLQLSTPAQPHPTRPLPPYNGFGSEEDSLVSCKHLVLRAPQKDLHKLLEFNNVTLRFIAFLVDPEGNKLEDRKFVVSYWLADGTLSISEPSARAFIVGTKRLDRTKVLKPGFQIGQEEKVDRYYTDADLQLGARIDCFGFLYELVDADDFVFAWMEKNGRLNGEEAAKRGKEVIKGLGYQGRVALERELKRLDRRRDWTVQRGEMIGFLREVWGGVMDDNEIFSIVGRFRKEKAPESIQYVKFLEVFVYPFQHSGAQ